MKKSSKTSKNAINFFSKLWKTVIQHYSSHMHNSIRIYVNMYMYTNAMETIGRQIDGAKCSEIKLAAFSGRRELRYRNDHNARAIYKMP